MSLDSALRRIEPLRELVATVAAAPAHEPETHAVEWKSELDLAASAGARFSCARQILGFSNRDPDRAAREFEGCAYLLVGVEPDCIHGCEACDPADIDNWISDYLGADGPQWQPTYVEAEGKTVLVITVEPPHWGDPIRTLRKGYESVAAGRVFVRRAGKTMEADPAEVHMLEERAKRSNERIALTLTGVPRGGLLQPYVAQRRDAAEWVGQERWRLESALAEYQSRSRERPWARGAVDREIRTVEVYRDEVELYLASARDRWQALLWEGVVQQRIGEIELLIENASDRNFAAVEVGVTMPGVVHPFLTPSEAHERLDSPKPPVPYGQRTMAQQIAGQIVASEPDFREARAGSSGDRSEVVFDPRQVRPRQRHPLPPIHIAVPQPLVGETVEISWRATSTSADGEVGGVLEIPVGESAASAISLVPVRAIV